MRGEALQQALNNIFYAIIAALIRIFKMLQYDVNTIQYNMIWLLFPVGELLPGQSVTIFVTFLPQDSGNAHNQMDIYVSGQVRYSWFSFSPSHSWLFDCFSLFLIKVSVISLFISFFIFPSLWLSLILDWHSQTVPLFLVQWSRVVSEIDL